MDLREKIAGAILQSQNEQSRYTVAPDNLKLADAILAIPEIRDALACLSGGSRTWEQKQDLR